MNTNDPTVTVSTPCTCNAKRWFYCTCSTIIAVYQCQNWDHSGEPHPEAVASISKLHPGMDLIY